MMYKVLHIPSAKYVICFESKDNVVFVHDYSIPEKYIDIVLNILTSVKYQCLIESDIIVSSQSDFAKYCYNNSTLQKCHPYMFDVIEENI